MVFGCFGEFSLLLLFFYFIPLPLNAWNKQTIVKNNCLLWSDGLCQWQELFPASTLCEKENHAAATFEYFHRVNALLSPMSAFTPQNTWFVKSTIKFRHCQFILFGTPVKLCCSYCLQSVFNNKKSKPVYIGI